MKKFLLILVWAFSSIFFLYSCKQPVSQHIPVKVEDRKKNRDKYSGPMEMAELEMMQTSDPSLGYAPVQRLDAAIRLTEESKRNAATIPNLTVLWQERGPIYDLVGPSNGNARGNNGYTSGRMAAVLVDTLNDPTGNTVIVGGISGGVWKCSNFLSEIPNWKNVNDYFGNMAISSICQDPSNSSIIYFSTGEATSNADAQFGKGIWKSTDKGESFTHLPSTINYIRNFKIACDAAGNVYLASRLTNTPALNTAGLLRSKDGGTTWVNITPSALGTVIATATCNDIEISSTGKLHASFGYSTAGTTVKPYFTADPANVTQASGWTLGTGIRNAGTPLAMRMELAVLADTLYAMTVNTAANSDSTYKSIDGGATWVKQNTAAMPPGLLSGQGWYNHTLAINPSNSSELLSGGLDAYRSVNGGQTWTRSTFWVTTVPYVHADHHYMMWWRYGNESRVIIGGDGGVFISRDNGVSWKDKNRNLGLKQFYAAAIHPAAGSPYLLAGAQDNGTHQISNPGLTYSTEVTGGDGMYCYINQQDPSIQFASYVYNQYRRSVNGGATWQSVNLSGSAGLFANPFDYDEAQNIMYAADAAGSFRRWPNANTLNASTVISTGAVMTGQAGAVTVSPYTSNRVYLGATNGRVIRIDNANATPTFTNITGSGFSTGYINNLSVGSSDNNLVATFTNFGVNNVWITTDGGTNWTAVDGNLPDMPVWWALYDPTNNNRMMLATETGIWTTDLLNGSNTIWTANPGFPTTRVRMLRMRASDRTVVASSYGRGLFTGVFSASLLPEISFIYPSTQLNEEASVVAGCRPYKDYNVSVGALNAPTGNATVTYSVQAGGSAIQGIDYDFTTNGNFTTPSTTHTFPTGSTSIQMVTIRIYDDASIEGIENFTLSLAVSGATDAVAGSIRSHVLSIADNDRLPIPYSTADYSIGTYNTDLTSLNTPFDGTKLKHRVQVLYTANELRAAGIVTGATISAATIKVKTKNSVRPFLNFNVSISNSFNISLPNYAPEVLTPVFTSASYNTVAGNNIFIFNSPFVWDGTSNIVMQYCYDNLSYGTPDNLIDIVEGNSAPLGAGVRGSAYSNWTTSTAAGCAIAAAFISDVRANATFKITFGDQVATTLNSTKTESLGTGTDIYYFSSDRKEIMARIVNLSTQNFGCTQVTIDRAGNAAAPFWNNNPANFLMDKTFRIVPVTNSVTGKYEVTFYFTPEEKAGWEAATGQSWNDIQVLKLPSQIRNVTPVLTQPDGANTIRVIPTVKRTFGNYYTLSAVFDNGFSGYGFGVPGRMNMTLTLTAAVFQNTIDIDLTWVTSAEINSTLFEVEKSYDGVTFHRIGTVNASGTKYSPSSYPFTDHENVMVNYYRIKMLHSDGTVIYSNVVLITKPYIGQQPYVLTNPFGSTLQVRLAVAPTGPVMLSLYDDAGKLVKRVVDNSGNMLYTVNTSNIMSRAIYMLRVDANGKKFAIRVMKQ